MALLDTLSSAAQTLSDIYDIRVALVLFIAAAALHSYTVSRAPPRSSRTSSLQCLEPSALHFSLTKSNNLRKLSLPVPDLVTGGIGTRNLPTRQISPIKRSLDNARPNLESFGVRMEMGVERLDGREEAVRVGG